MNKVILMGRLTADPELRYTQNTNIPVCTFRLAVNRKNAKESEVKADFFPIVAWNKAGEFCSKYFKKGQQVAVTGRLQTSTYEDKDGKTTYKTEVIADEVYFADSNKEPTASQQTTKEESTADDFTPITDDDLPF